MTATTDRYERLTTGARSLRGRRRENSEATWLYVVGGALVSLGLVAAVLGYVGASRTIYVFEQIPYLMSGGILGACLVIAGGFAYAIFWLTRLHAELTEHRAAAVQSAESLRRLEGLMADLLAQQARGGKR
jgi:hypothetical protein